MKTQNIEKGKLGEDLAEKALKKQKYKILERNFRCKVGEIDIVAKHKGVLVFVEVKSRSSTEFGFPREAVTIFKQRSIVKCAHMFMLKHNLSDIPVRFDVVEVLDGKVTVFCDAFGGF